MSDITKGTLAALDEHWDFHNRGRSYFPYLKEDAVGATRIETAPWYQSQGYRVILELEEPLTTQGRDKNNAIAGWQNENFLIRVCAVLEDAKVIPKKDKQWMKAMIAAGGDSCLVAITIRLRNYFVHEMGRYNYSDSEHQETVDLMKKNIGYALTEKNEWNTSITEVLKPLFEACRRFAARA